MHKKHREERYTRKRTKKHLKRKRVKAKRRKRWEKHLDTIRKSCRKNKTEYSPLPPLHQVRYFELMHRRPELSEIIQFIASKSDAFVPSTKLAEANQHVFKVPRVFSLTNGQSESYLFIRQLFDALYHQQFANIVLDYSVCEQIDVDASACMDVLLKDFVIYMKKCRRRGYEMNVKNITTTNIVNPDVAKVILSIGAFNTIHNLRVGFPDVEPYHLCIGDKKNPKLPSLREVHITNMVDYIIRCLDRMGHALTPKAENDLYKVIGETIINAEEHSNTSCRYSIGYFQETNGATGAVGTFNLAIMNFGRTIYEVFSDPDCPNTEVVARMKELSANYTKKRVFRSAEFEEETLWTLYALQEGVTSKKDWKRGNGSIRFIESFFNLKGDSLQDTISNLTIVSGHTRIVFDGTYRVIEKPRGGRQKLYKMMTFNESGDINDKPDKKFVNFADNYFPGTIISAKICIKPANTETATGLRLSPVPGTLPL